MRHHDSEDTSKEGLSNQDDQGSSNEGVRSVLKTAGKVGKYTISPYMFSKRDMNPYRDNSNIWNRLKKLFKSKRTNKFESIEEVIEENPDFENVRPLAMKKLKSQRNVYMIVFVFWSIYGAYQLYAGFSLIGSEALGLISYTLWTFIIIGMLVVADIRYLVFKHRLLRLSLMSWMGRRFG